MHRVLCVLRLVVGEEERDRALNRVSGLQLALLNNMLQHRQTQRGAICIHLSKFILSVA
jgi:hypothetical protein